VAPLRLVPTANTVLFWVLTVVYVLLFGLVTAAVFTAIDRID
jgi:hypothetical protein